MLNASINGASSTGRAGIHLLSERRSSNPPGLHLVEQGAALVLEDIPPGVFRIAEGCISLSLPLAAGRRQILDVLGPGRLVGANLSGVRQCSAIALAPTRLRALDPALEGRGTVDGLQQMLWRAQSHASLLGRRTMTERVAFALLDLADQFAAPATRRSRSGITFPLHLTRADLADWLGLTLSTVSRCLNAFKHRGLIAFDNPKHITIRDRNTLEALASGSSVSACRSPRRSGRSGLEHAGDPVAPAADLQAS